tara:strand:+ start:333 stop:584 length:252 start_codon:yes stop_codon:yes gene_type:complete
MAKFNDKYIEDMSDCLSTVTKNLIDLKQETGSHYKLNTAVFAELSLKVDELEKKVANLEERQGRKLWDIKRIKRSIATVIGEV